MHEQTNLPDPSDGGSAPSTGPRDPGRGPEEKRRGRPPGTVSLTPEIQERILELIRAGVYDFIAAEAVGISERTLREWIQRGEGLHPTRPATRKLRRFAREFRQAKAEARASAEIRVYRDNPVRWLSYVGRAKPGREGWTHPPETQAPDTATELEALIRALDEPDCSVTEEDEPGDEAVSPRVDGSEDPR
jgi:hypothetical protein